MKTVETKRKRAPTRHEKALATRRRMVKAAYDLFCTRGYAATTMDAIADAAGVAVQTLYFTFHTKGTILGETLGAAILGFERWDPKVERALAANPEDLLSEWHAWFRAFDREKVPVHALAIFVDASLEILARVGPLAAVLTSAAASDPDVKVANEVGERRRVADFRNVVENLTTKGKLRRGVTVRRATDILLTILSAETYQQLTAGRGWSHAECRRWLLDVLAQQLLPPTAE